ncbi:MAG: hypothetical protein J6J03_00150, partial [Tyzzerella sp.]|nr:hypothetical protein [Tyzzerella sp.]
MGANSECRDYAAHHAFFLKFASGLVFLNICFVMTSYGHIVCWSAGLLVTTNQLTNTPTNHYLLVITD